MITKKQLKILEVFIKNPFEEYLFGEIKKLSEEKSNSVLQRALIQFAEEDILKKRKIGTSKLYSINHNNKKIYSYFNIFIQENLSEKVRHSIDFIKEELDKHLFFYSIGIFGSYVYGKQTKNSDLDIVIFFEDERKRKIIEAVIESINIKSILKIDGHAISQKEFLEMLNTDYENLGKEIARKHLIILNQEIFYSMLKKGVDNGFKF